MQNNKHNQLSYIDQGQGTPILFIHGYPLSKKLWEEQIEGLSSQFRCIAPDLRGYGQSALLAAQVEKQHFSMDMFAEDCANLLTDLGIREPVVVTGLSMGGYISLAFYKLYPNRVRSLVLTATRAGADSLEAQNNRDKAVDTVTHSGSRAIFEAMLPKLISPSAYANKPELVKRVEGIMDEATHEGIVASLLAMKTRPDSTLLLPNITCPSLIIHGADDQIIPITEAQSMHNSIPEAELVIIEKAGHLPNLEQPDTYNQVLQRFLRSL